MSASLKARLGKRYTINAGGNQFQRVLVTTADGRVLERDVKVREGWHGPILHTNAEAKALVLAQLVAVCDNCGASPITVTTESGRFCDQACADAYDLR